MEGVLGEDVLLSVPAESPASGHQFEIATGGDSAETVSEPGFYTIILIRLIVSLEPTSFAFSN
jgi:hypothetical protein